MIKANELRIGNYFIDGDGEYGTVHQLYFVESPSHKYVNGWDYDSIEPIPITPEILEKSGLIKDLDSFYKEITEDGWRIEIEETDKWDVYIRNESGEATILCSIDSLHEFQNVFFAITKEELEITL